MTTIPNIPDLRIVPVEAVMPHEEHDAQRSVPLIQRIELSNEWLNPPIVAPFHQQDGRDAYVVLDGANRYHSLCALEIPHILVQVVDYHGENVQLETWDHVLSDLDTGEWLKALSQIKGLHLEASDHDTAEAALDLGTAIAYLRILPEQIIMLVSDETDLHGRTRKLRELVDTYKTIAKIDRHNGDHPDVVRLLHPHAVAVVVFPQYSPEDIIAAARDLAYLPPGISRHIIQGRAMRLHYPLEALRDMQTPLEEKNAALRQWMQERVSRKAMRLYAEATYIFDD